MIDTSAIPIFILCGGLGTRLKEETEFRPKPMVPVGPRPIMWHIMKSYSRFGFRRFILCAGFKQEVIKSYFMNYGTLNSDFTVNLETSELTVHSSHHNENWEVTIAFTGEENMTGSRLFLAAEKYLDAEVAGVTYGDGLTDVNFLDELEFHQSTDKIGTVLGVNPPSRFGELQIEGTNVKSFSEKPEFKEKWINGGFFFFKKEFFRHYLSPNPQCVLEQAPLVNLAKDKELGMFKHPGFWACMDTQRDRDMLNSIWKKGDPPWLSPIKLSNYALV